MLLRTGIPDPDKLAGNLARWGAIGRSMPPSWDGCEHMIRVARPTGEYLGEILPGRGLLLDRDLKYLGVKRPIPNVFERSPVHRFYEVIRSRRAAIAAVSALVIASQFSRSALIKLIGPMAFGAITSYDGIISGRAGGNAYDVVANKASDTTVANAWHSLYQVGGFPGAGTYSGTPGAALHHGSAGAWSVGLPNVSSNSAYLLTFGFNAAQQINILVLVDILVQVGSLAINNTTVTVSSAALTRYTTGAGVWATFEVTTALSATNAGSMTMSYTNQAGTAGQSAPGDILTVSAIVHRLQPVTQGFIKALAAGDFGVRAVASITTSLASATTGVVALNLFYPLAFIPGVAANVYMERDSTVQIDGLSQIQNDASNNPGYLMGYILPNTTTSGILTAFMRTVYG